MPIGISDNTHIEDVATLQLECSHKLCLLRRKVMLVNIGNCYYRMLLLTPNLKKFSSQFNLNFLNHKPTNKNIKILSIAKIQLGT